MYIIIYKINNYKYNYTYTVHVLPPPLRQMLCWRSKAVPLAKPCLAFSLFPFWQWFPVYLAWRKFLPVEYCDVKTYPTLQDNGVRLLCLPGVEETSLGVHVYFWWCGRWDNYLSQFVVNCASILVFLITRVQRTHLCALCCALSTR